MSSGGWRWGAALVGVAIGMATAGCEGTQARTQVMVVLTADPAIAAEASAVRLRVRGGATADDLGDAFEGTRPEPSFPLEAAIVPAGGDAGRRFRVEASALSGDDAIATVRAETGFVAGRTLELRLHFAEACRGVSCGDAETCRTGACEPAAVDAASLPPYQGGAPADGGVPDAGSDAGAMDASSDANVPDGAADAAAADAGMCVPEANERCDGRDQDCDDRIDEAAADCATGDECFEGACQRRSDDWFIPLEGAGSDRIEHVAVDANGNSYVQLRITAEADLATQDLPIGSARATNYVVALDAAGVPTWNVQLPPDPNVTTSATTVRDLATTELGIVYVAGHFQGRPTFAGQTPSQSSEGWDSFVLSLAPNGDARRLAVLTGNGDQTVSRLGLDAMGSAYALGRFTDDVRTGSLTSPDRTGDATVGNFVTKYGPNGISHQWTTVLPFWFSSIAVGGGRVFVHGLLEGEVVLEDHRYQSTLFKDLIVALDAEDGRFLWSKLLDDEGPAYGEEYAAALSADDQGNVYVVHGLDCEFTTCEVPTIDLGGPEPFPDGAFLASYGPDGAFRFARVFEDIGVGELGTQSLRFGRDGSLALSAGFRGTIDLGTGPLAPAGSTDALLARFDRSGNTLSVDVLGGTSSDRAEDGTTDANGRTVMVGSFQDVISADGRPYVAEGLDGFVWSRSFE